jgi:hypothetical protein
MKNAFRVIAIVVSSLVVGFGAVEVQGRPLAKPDLRIQRLRVVGPVGASLQVQITVRNRGRAAAAPFRTDAYMTTPRRWLLLVTLCPLTRLQQYMGGSAPCGSPFTVDPLPPGGTVAYTAYVTWPTDHASGTSERIEFMADGCFATLEPWLPVYCRVDESNERNNTRSLTVTVP